MRNAIEARDVARKFEVEGREVGLHGLSFQVEAGQVLAVLGHNGAGKTTLVRGLTTLATFDSGEAFVAGYDVSREGNEVRARVGLVGQAAAVDEQLSATRNLVLFGRLRGLSRFAAETRAAELLDEFGLSNDAERVVSQFSGGMRRRLDLAASLVIRPEVLFVDEPTTGLDPAARRDLWAALRGLVAEGTTLLLTTQYLEEADELADKVIVLSEGRAVAAGTPRELKDRVGEAAIWVRVDRPDQTEDALQALRDVDPEARLTSPLTLTASARRPTALADSAQALQARGVRPAEIALRRPTLEDVFLTISASSNADGLTKADGASPPGEETSAATAHGTAREIHAPKGSAQGFAESEKKTR
ncbi:ATP-binding cassette domain-containing protein [Nocardioides okcheonensis]|uniref:ATP-binding cassette domain-containing protein n=1 Tax=Nocardioides okcheonensis TaxID=2894081 RepID=UPI001E4A1A13|nr:ATP-binding cassette domain-containing protein [Nocardioides okcheonensis]UFN45161.1 ATP-binding cassette domain-containing protein [Nocardioides okcheonensis]